MAIRKNTLIFVIAGVLVWAVLLLEKRRVRYLGIISVMLLSTAAGIIMPRKFYEFRAGNTMGEGVPAIAYIAMGLQWSEGRSPGGWNGYHVDLYMSCSYDAGLTAEISAENARDSLRYMAGHPDYLAEFFYRKQVEQWCREDYACLYGTLEFYGERTSAAWEIYQGKTKDSLLNIMSLHQSLVYTGASCFCMLAAIRWHDRKRRAKSDEGGDLEGLILLVTFIGGFLFSMIWEAGARYVMPYFVMLLPYAADVLARGSYWMEKRIEENKTEER